MQTVNIEALRFLLKMVELFLTIKIFKKKHVWILIFWLIKGYLRGWAIVLPIRMKIDCWSIWLSFNPKLMLLCFIRWLIICNSQIKKIQFSTFFSNRVEMNGSKNKYSYNLHTRKITHLCLTVTWLQRQWWKGLGRPTRFLIFSATQTLCVILVEIVDQILLKCGHICKKKIQN